jgi:glucose/arabinose dehydrogenase
MGVASRSLRQWEQGLLLTAISFMALALAACGDTARLQVSAGTGPQPTLPAAQQTLIPTVNIAPAQGWPPGLTPVAASGTRVAAFASGLNHPRWLLTLPNGDVLVAETNAPPKPEDATGVKGWVMGLVMARAGAKAPSANRITLLRDSDGDGVADVKSVFLEGLSSPFGMALVDSDLYVANTDSIVRFPYLRGQTRIAAPGTVLTTVPAGPVNHHWTKNLIASPNTNKLYATVGSNSNVAERGMPAEFERAAIWEVDIKSGAHRATLTVWLGSQEALRYGQ